MMDEALGCARVKVQYGDDEQKLEVNHPEQSLCVSEQYKKK